MPTDLDLAPSPTPQAPAARADSVAEAAAPRPDAPARGAGQAPSGAAGSALPGPGPALAPGAPLAPAPGRPGGERLPDAASVQTLGQAIRVFYRHPSPWILSAVTFALLAARVALGGWSPWDAVIVAALIAWQPFQEWLIHVYLLHWRPRTVLGVHLDLKLARRHREHHEDPSDLPIVFMPIDAMLTSLVVNSALVTWLMPTWGLAATALAMVSGIGLVYEWTHFLIHTSYRPRTAFYRRIWRYHRLHHFKNEHYWFGVTMHQGDRVLGTLPDHREVETSKTARDLNASLGAPRARPAG